MVRARVLRRRRMLARMRSDCEGKRRYEDEAAADRGADRARRRYGRARQRAYACPWCGGWHLTTRGTIAPRPR